MSAIELKCYPSEIFEREPVCLQGNQFRNPQDILSEIQEQLASNQRIIRVAGALKLTKSQKHPTHVYLLRDFDLESAVRSWISERTSYSQIISRYAKFDPSLCRHDWPRHYAVRILAGLGAICSGSNIFMFFPEVLGLQAGSFDECFGFEFIDIWSNIFHQNIFPCWRTIFDFESQAAFIPALTCHLEKTIFLASVFHEIGHRVGPFKISPQKSQWLQIPAYHLDVLGELATDSLLVLQLREFPEIAQFVFSQRLFWFGRRGFGDNPESVWLNHDNDSWISAMLWNKSVEAGVLEKQGQKYRFHQEHLVAMFEQILNDIDSLGRQLKELKCASHQEILVESWMKQNVNFSTDGGFTLSRGQREAFYACQNIVEIPHFAPMLNFSFK